MAPKGNVFPQVLIRRFADQPVLGSADISLGGSTTHEFPYAGSPAPGLRLIKRSEVAEVRVGMDRASVEAALGKPHSVMAIHGADEDIETLIYNLDDKAAARVRTINGKVVSVQFLD